MAEKVSGIEILWCGTNGSGFFCACGTHRPEPTGRNKLFLDYSKSKKDDGRARRFRA